jgi:hypothetical protein
MGWLNQIGGILQQYAGGGASATQGRNVEDDFQKTAEAAPREVLTDSLAKAFRSDATPSFPEIVSNLFRNSQPDQQAGIINTLLKNVSPTAITSILGQIGLANLGGMLGGGGSNLAPSQARDVSPDTVKNLAANAEQHEPSVVDRVAEFYADHPTLVRSLGAAAMGEVLRHVASRQGG